MVYGLLGIYCAGWNRPTYMTISALSDSSHNACGFSRLRFPSSTIRKHCSRMLEIRWPVRLRAISGMARRTVKKALPQRRIKRTGKAYFVPHAGRAFSASRQKPCMIRVEIIV